MLLDIRTYWREIGENLGLAPEDLNEIANKEQCDDAAHLGQMLLKWLRQAHTPERPITWETLVSALQEGKLEEATGAIVEKISKCQNISTAQASELDE